MTLPDFFVQIPIDSRGNSPRFEYRPITYADLEGLGEKLWWCADGQFADSEENETCIVHIAGDLPCGWRLLIPPPDIAAPSVDQEVTFDAQMSYETQEVEK